MARYHISKDGAPRICAAQTVESCTAVGVDGESAPHGDFKTPEEARRFAESVLEKNLGDGLTAANRADISAEREVVEDFPRERVDNRTPQEKADDLRESVKDFRNPRTSELERETIRSFWRDNGVANQFDAMSQAAAILKSADNSSEIVDRDLFSKDTFDDSSYRVEGGRLKGDLDGDGYDMGKLRELTREQFDEEVRKDLGKKITLKEGDVQTYEIGGNELGAYARIGGKFYRADGTGELPVEDRKAFSTDMTDAADYYVEGGRLKAEEGDESYDLGRLTEISHAEIDEWSMSTLGEKVNFQDGEIFPSYDYDGNEAGAYARFGDKFYRAGGNP